MRLLVFVLIFSWIFSGWPQIFNFLPGIQVARADVASKTYSFPSDSEGWSNTACGAAGATCQWLSSDGSPANGSLNGVETRKNKSGTYSWQLSGVSWESLGVPSGATVTAVDGSYNHKAAVCTNCISTSGDLLIRDSGDSATIATLETAISYSAATAWATRDVSGAQAVGASYQASNTGIILRITGTLGNLNVTGASTDIRQDEIVFTVTYTPPAGSITVDIVDGSYVSVGSPIMAMNTTTFSFICQTVTGSFGTASEQIYVNNNNGANGGWTLTVAAQATTNVLDSVGTDYDFNDPTGSGCTDGADAGDTVGGQMTIDPSVATLAVGQCGACSTANVSKGSSSAFNEGATDTITLLNATAASDDVGDWTLQGVSISQKIPAEQPAASDYDINMVLTVTAS